MSGAGVFHASVIETAFASDLVSATLVTIDIPSSHGGPFSDYAIKPGIQTGARKLWNAAYDWIGAHLPAWDSVVAKFHAFSDQVGLILADGWQSPGKAFIAILHWLFSWFG